MSQVMTAQNAWGDTMPDWIRTLAQACADSSQNQVARRLGYSSTVVSLVLRNKYVGDIVGVELAVRGTFENLCIACPVLGEIPLLDCRDWQQKARTYSNENSMRVRMFRACNRCPQRKEA
ncbi:hypothetical protein [Maritimibacter alkaliphilus]|uniref:hypothetical protein n=1 Tax=Maritimibacter alkaliphilus TaxID=404236 RepID=UPI0021BD8FC9|nr:hypothetical protein [Maritimibacter alkaliphilus]